MPDILEKWQVMPHDPLTAVDDGILSVAGEIHMPLGVFPRRMTAGALRALAKDLRGWAWATAIRR